jgi:hypothetical protein
MTTVVAVRTGLAPLRRGAVGQSTSTVTFVGLVMMS